MLEWLCDVLGSGPPLKRQDRSLWEAARTLPDLCELTAQWLEGRIDSQPGYYGTVDVDDAPYLLESLIGLNRCGFLTNQSQEGFDGLAFDGAPAQQLAVVEGFADDDAVKWLADVLSGTRFELIVYPVKKSWRQRASGGIVVTTWGGYPHTRFGKQLSAGSVAFSFDGCSDEAIEAVCAAWQVTVYDPEPGLNDLWPVLYEACC